ncbi:hypothetical protein [Streptomyces celluloflavus]|uniref:hypothetical protein n=1 Tax=Streptomyces celluloflavus TaxID=58344 RepID=UPI0036CEA0DF
MRRIRPITVFLVGLTTALTFSTGTALAAKGPFTFQNGGKPFFVQDPPNGKCFTMSQVARSPHNGADSPATVFSDKKCKGNATRIAPGHGGPKGLSFSSVRFG